MISLDDISIRTTLKSGDIGHVVLLHGLLYSQEYGYGIAFEGYVAAALQEFYQQYDTKKDRVWIAEHNEKMVGFLLLMHRENNSSQLRFFCIVKAYRGIGLGRKMMDLYMTFYRDCRYTSSYLWTSAELHGAAALYRSYGFFLTDEKPSTAFGKPVIEQRYELNLVTHL